MGNKMNPKFVLTKIKISSFGKKKFSKQYGADSRHKYPHVHAFQKKSNVPVSNCNRDLSV